MHRPAASRLRLLSAGLVVALFVALVAVLAVATPRSHLVPPPRSDVALFLRSQGDSGTCAVVVWLHVRYARPGIDLVVVPPDVLVQSSGAPAVPLHSVIEQQGPAAGARALSALLGVSIGGWASLNMDPVLQSMGMTTLAAALTADNKGGGRPLTAAEYDRQVGLLRAAAVLAPRKVLPVPTVENYVFGSGKVATSLGINDVAWVARAMREAAAGDVAVLALPARVAVTSGGPLWRVDAAGVAALVRELRRRPTAPAVSGGR